jgi:GTP-binding protein
MKFVDFADIHVKAGDGGAGCMSFRREKFVPKGGPDGGNGGRGGDVRIRANSHLTTLLDFQYRREYRAPRGTHGLGSRKTGPSGSDIVLEVPCGTIIRDTDSGKTLGDLVSHSDEITVAQGGRGGRGNAEFATSTNQAPRHWEAGSPGEARTVQLELKLLADVGLIGLPNAGKSTLISVISAARPKIADYPFTTLVPNLGIVRAGEGKSFVVADIPGLIEGAHAGKGLGIQFLRHIERTKVLVYLLDGTRDSLVADFETLQRELALFNTELPKKPSLIAVTKIDALSPGQVRRLRMTRFGRKPVLLVSAVARRGITELVHAMWNAISRRPRRRG